MKIERQTYDVHEVAEILGVSRTKVYEAVKNNEIPHRWMGRRVLFPGSGHPELA